MSLATKVWLLFPGNTRPMKMMQLQVMNYIPFYRLMKKNTIDWNSCFNISLVVMDSIMSMIIGLKYTLHFCVQNVTKGDVRKKVVLKTTHYCCLDQSFNDLLAPRLNPSLNWDIIFLYHLRLFGIWWKANNHVLRYLWGRHSYSLSPQKIISHNKQTTFGFSPQPALHKYYSSTSNLDPSNQYVTAIHIASTEILVSIQQKHSENFLFQMGFVKFPAYKSIEAMDTCPSSLQRIYLKEHGWMAAFSYGPLGFTSTNSYEW